MWNETKSLTLSKLCVKLFMALLIGLGVSAPFWLKSLLAFYSELGLEAFYAYFLCPGFTIFHGFYSLWRQPLSG